MSNIEHGNDAGPADVPAGCSRSNTDERVTVTCSVVALTNFGERPVPSTRLAEVLGRPVREAEALARRWGWPGTQVADGLITVNPERARSAARRQVQIGHRRFGVSGCAGDIFWAAPLVRPSLQLEETCPVTGTPIQIMFTPSGVEHVEPAGAVMAILDPEEVTNALETAGDIEEIDANVCVRCSPLFSSADAAQGWLADHTGGRVFPVRQAWDLSGLRELRDRMSVLMNLDN